MLTHTQEYVQAQAPALLEAINKNGLALFLLVSLWLGFAFTSFRLPFPALAASLSRVIQSSPVLDRVLVPGLAPLS